MGKDDHGVPVLPLMIESGMDRLRDDSSDGKDGETQFKQTPGEADPVGLEPASWGVGHPHSASSQLLCHPHRQGDQAGETKANHLLLQPTALLQPGKLHSGAAH